MYKVIELVEKIRIGRNKLWKIGLFVIFLIGLVIVIFNYLLWKDLNYVNYLSCESDFQDSDLFEIEQTLNNFNIQNLKAQISSNNVNQNNLSVVMVLISDLDYETAFKDKNFKKFVDLVEIEEKTGKLLKVNFESSSSVSNLITYFTGTKLELHGIKGNVKTNYNNIQNFDSIFKQINNNNNKKSSSKLNIVSSFNFLSNLQYYFPEILYLFQLKNEAFAESENKINDFKMNYNNNYINNNDENKFLKFKKLYLDLIKSNEIKNSLSILQLGNNYYSLSFFLI